MDGDITLREAQQLVDQWIRQYGVRYFSELTNMACLTEEVGELARVCCSAWPTRPGQTSHMRCARTLKRRQNATIRDILTMKN